MKRILEDSPVAGHQLFRYQDTRADGTQVVHPNFYVRHAGRTECLKTANLKEAKGKVKKIAGQDAEGQRRLTAPPIEVRIGALLDLVIEDYKRSGRKTIILRRVYQLGYERRPQLVDRIPPIKKVGENNARKGFVTPQQYRSVLAELPECLTKLRMSY